MKILHLELPLLVTLLFTYGWGPEARSVDLRASTPPALDREHRVEETASPATYFGGHAEGWFWYRDPSESDVPEPLDSPPVSSAPVTDDPVAEIERQRKTLEVALDRAVLHPTPENMESYLALNGMLLAQSANFANAWKGTLYTKPALDYRQVSPVGAAAHVRADIARRDDERRLGAAASDWGLVFFFRGACPYCHQFAPVLKQFAARFGFRIVDVTLDGGALPEFPSPQINADAGKALGVDAVPAVFLINPRTREVAPAAYGLLGWSELAERVLYALDHLEDREADTRPRVATIGESP